MMVAPCMALCILWTDDQFKKELGSWESAVCIGIALTRSELPTELIGRYNLMERQHLRGSTPEFRFLYRDRRPRLPVVRDGVLQLAKWGNRDGRSRFLPRTGWTWRESVEAGLWAEAGAVPVDVPASFALERRGVWYVVEVGIRAVLVPDEFGTAVCYLICEEASRYYRVMTGADRMPMLIGQRI